MILISTDYPIYLPKDILKNRTYWYCDLTLDESNKWEDLITFSIQFEVSSSVIQSKGYLFLYDVGVCT